MPWKAAAESGAARSTPGGEEAGATRARRSLRTQHTLCSQGWSCSPAPFSLPIKIAPILIFRQYPTPFGGQS